MISRKAFFNYFAMFTVLAPLAMVGLAFVWLVVQKPPVIMLLDQTAIGGYAYDTDTIKLHPGDIIEVRRDYCVERQPTVDGVMVRELRDAATGKILVHQHFVVPKDQTKIGCYAKEFRFLVPSNTPPGEYIYDASMEHQINLLTTSYFAYPSLKVTLLEPANNDAPHTVNKDTPEE